MQICIRAPQLHVTDHLYFDMGGLSQLKCLQGVEDFAGKV